jgi:Ca2+-binding RTX toxin-like protein
MSPLNAHGSQIPRFSLLFPCWGAEVGRKRTFGDAAARGLPAGLRFVGGASWATFPAFVLAFFVVIGVLAVVPFARAGTVTVAGATMTFRANAAEANDVRVTWVGEEEDGIELQVTDGAAPLTAGQGCLQRDEHGAECRLRHHGHVRITLGDMNDRASVADACDLGEEAAWCSATVEGGEGSDTLSGSEWLPAERLLGGPGDDLLEGGQVLDGGPGADTLRGPTSGCAEESGGVAVYRDRVGPVFVSLNGRRDDGEAGENDLVVNVVGILGGSGNDVIFGDRCGNWLKGGGGNDLVAGRGGGDLLRGGAGQDRILGGRGGDSAYGESGRDTIDGHVGRDTIRGGSGRDRMRGWGENDTFYARDGYRDVVDRGRGTASIDASIERAQSNAGSSLPRHETSRRLG